MLSEPGFAYNIIDMQTGKHELLFLIAFQLILSVDINYYSPYGMLI